MSSELERYYRSALVKIQVTLEHVNYVSLTGTEKDILKCAKDTINGVGRPPKEKC